MILSTEQARELVDGFQSFLMGTMAENTAVSYAIDAKRMLEQCNNDTDGFTKTNVRRFVEYGGHDTRCSASTQVRHRAALRAFVKYMSQECDHIKVSESVVANIKTQRLGRKIPEFLTSEEIEALFSAVAKDMTSLAIRDRAFLEVMYAGGLRVDEAMHIRIGDLMFGEKTSKIRILGKGSKERMVIIGNRAVKWLRDYLEFHRSQLTETSGMNELVFVSARGNALTRATIWKMLQKAAVDAGINPAKVHPHVLRHSFATHMLNGGANLMVIKELLGHSSIATTQIYLTVSDRDKTEAYLKAFGELG